MWCSQASIQNNCWLVAWSIPWIGTTQSGSAQGRCRASLGPTPSSCVSTLVASRLEARCSWVQLTVGWRVMGSRTTSAANAWATTNRRERDRPGTGPSTGPGWGSSSPSSSRRLGIACNVIKYFLGKSLNSVGELGTSSPVVSVQLFIRSTFHFMSVSKDLFCFRI